MTSTRTRPSPGDRLAEAGNKRATKNAIHECESVARGLIKRGDFAYDALLDLMRKFPLGESYRHRDTNGGQRRTTNPWSAGLYVHGKWVGMTNRSSEYPHVVRYINLFMRHRGSAKWSSFATHKSTLMKPHVDVNNAKQESSTTVTLGRSLGNRCGYMSHMISPEQMWCGNRTDRDANGRLVSFVPKPFQFSPHVLHATHPWWCRTACSVRDATQVDQDVWDAVT